MEWTNTLNRYTKIYWLEANEHFHTYSVQIIIGECIFIGGAYLFKMESFGYVLDILKGYMNKK